MDDVLHTAVPALAGPTCNLMAARKGGKTPTKNKKTVASTDDTPMCDAMWNTWNMWNMWNA
jgi:hypothetical protein